MKRTPVVSKQSGVESGGRLRFDFDRTQRAGVYVFKLTQRWANRWAAAREERAYAYNVDTANESDLRWASKAELEKIASGVKVQFAGGG